MERLTEKQRKIIYIVATVILVGILIYLTIGVIKDIKERKNSKIVNAEETVLLGEEQITDIEEDGEEIDITELEEQNEVENDKENNNSTQKNNTTKTGSSSSPKVPSNKTYYIRVNYTANVVTIYTKDAEGNYTVPVKAMICSTGTATPRSGTYGIKGRWEWLGLLGGVYGHYSTQITGNILFHSVPYLKKWDPASLEYWEYDKLRDCMFCRMCSPNSS